MSAEVSTDEERILMRAAAAILRSENMPHSARIRDALWLLRAGLPSERRVSAPMYVYFAQAGSAGPIKIGTSVNPASRVAQLSTSSSEEIRLLATIPGGWERERELHDRFAALRLRGEWFAAEPDLTEFIGAIA